VEAEQGARDAALTLSEMEETVLDKEERMAELDEQVRVCVCVCVCVCARARTSRCVSVCDRAQASRSVSVCSCTDEQVICACDRAWTSRCVSVCAGAQTSRCVSVCARAPTAQARPVFGHCNAEPNVHACDHCASVLNSLLCACTCSSLLCADLCTFARLCLLSTSCYRMYVPCVCTGYRVGQVHTYMVHIRYFWQGNHHMYGHIWCNYTVLADPVCVHAFASILVMGKEARL